MNARPHVYRRHYLLLPCIERFQSEFHRRSIMHSKSSTASTQALFPFQAVVILIEELVFLFVNFNSPPFFALAVGDHYLS